MAWAANWIWGVFSSLKLALGLILLIGALSLLGAFLPGLDMFRSWWFVLSGTLLMLNILVCSLNRFGHVMHTIDGGEIRRDRDFYTEGAPHAEIDAGHLSNSDASQAAQAVLKRKGYRVRAGQDPDSIYLAADKYRYCRLGTFVNHLSLVLFVLAYVVGGYFGFREDNFVLVEGASRQIGHNTGLSLRLLSFTDEYYPDNTPRDYRSEVVIYEKGTEVQRAQVRVNRPLEYKGVRIYQSFFGPAVKIRISRNGAELFQGTVPLDIAVATRGVRRQAGSIALPADGLFVRLVGSAAGEADPLIPAGQLAIDTGPAGNGPAPNLAQRGVPLEINGDEYVYEQDKKFSGFQVSADPANVLIWIASCLFILGIVLVFYFPYRQAWILTHSAEPGNSLLLLRMGVPGGYSSGSELTALSDAIKRNLSAAGQHPGPGGK